ncbi:MAG: hypothetical protein AAAB35_24525 [Phyllobacterium sp.]|uniref:hypothetical protein n=1 Tax=Phyllobacterium sp. TaxID=1871046 RepID=UPI0030F358BA
MHDLTLILAIAAVALLAYQAEVDDRPPVHQEPSTRSRAADWPILACTATLIVLLVLAIFLA